MNFLENFQCPGANGFYPITSGMFTTLNAVFNKSYYISYIIHLKLQRLKDACCQTYFICVSGVGTLDVSLYIPCYYMNL